MKKDYIDISKIRQLCRDACARICGEEGLDPVDVQVTVTAPGREGRSLKIEVIERPERVVKGSRNWQDN